MQLEGWMLVPIFSAILLSFSLASHANPVEIERFYEFNITRSQVTRLCSTKNIVNVNGQFPGPEIHLDEGDMLVVKVNNQVPENITLHWHGVFQNRTGWYDGPAYVTQCPIQSGSSYTYKFVIKNQRGTLWWHAHIRWMRATVYGALIIHPRPGSSFPFPAPDAEVPILLGEWWQSDVQAVLNQALASGGGPNVSDAFTINGLPGPLYNCSGNDVYALDVEQGKTYLLRIINAAMNTDLFFGIANHKLTVVEADASYQQPFETDYIVITPGQTTNVLFTADQTPGQYFMAASAYAAAVPQNPFDNTTTAGIIRYKSSPSSFFSGLPRLPAFNDTRKVVSFNSKLRGLLTEELPTVPVKVDRHLFFTVGLNREDCPRGAPNSSCQGNGGRFAASINNITYVSPRSSILGAYYTNKLMNVFTKDFSTKPPVKFDYTGRPLRNLNSKNGTKARIIPYGSSVQIILQGTSLVNAESHPIHLHGYDFFIVGQGFGNYKKKYQANFNLVDPPLRNTISVPLKGWAAIRLIANNPGVWFMHCHLDIHTTWGLDTVLIVENGEGPLQSIQAPPPDYPRC
ncbi:laccase-12 [Selaginella moellendorffii]|uniref:laccase-12 n=1 Tax=Selaginella moellendorffii TaxID=88036 RepID=UPI000D1D0E42|nr:laccase-12 [Selaginella moellendorffii]|eukprot:XP_024516235.1 laccase-12 [Selaginella moellendorffii]